MGQRPQDTIPEVFRKIAEQAPDVDLDAVGTCNVMRIVIHELLTATSAHFARHDLSRGRFATMMQLMKNRETGRTPAELADSLCVSRASMTGLLDSLERSGFVSRERHPDDRRMITVRITGAGEDFLREMLPDHFRRLTRLVGHLSASERRTLVMLMKKLARGIPAVRDP